MIVLLLIMLMRSEGSVLPLICHELPSGKPPQIWTITIVNGKTHKISTGLFSIAMVVKNGAYTSWIFLLGDFLNFFLDSQ